MFTCKTTSGAIWTTPIHLSPCCCCCCCCHRYRVASARGRTCSVSRQNRTHNTTQLHRLIETSYQRGQQHKNSSLAWKWSVCTISFFSSTDRGFAVVAGGVIGKAAIPPVAAPAHLPDLEPGVDATGCLTPGLICMVQQYARGLTQKQDTAMPSTASNAPNGLLHKLREWINSLLCWLPARCSETVSYSKHRRQFPPLSSTCSRSSENASLLDQFSTKIVDARTPGLEVQPETRVEHRWNTVGTQLQ